MASSVQAAGRGSAIRPKLAPFIALAVLVPVIVLFLQTWRSLDDEIGFAQRERHGIAYLTALSSLATALTDAQSAAVDGRAVPREALSRAVDAVSAVDAELGDDLRTRDRWESLRTKIGSLPERGAASAGTVYAAYGEAADLLLGLFGKVRDTSNLLRDPEVDTYHLQDVAAEELPETIVAVGRLADQASMAPARLPAQRPSVVADLITARAAALDPATDLAEGLQAAVDSSNSRRLGESLLTRLDRFQLSIEAVAAQTAQVAERVGGTDLAALGTARAETQAAAAELARGILVELDVLIGERLAGLYGERRTAFITLLAAVLLAVTPVTFVWVDRRRARRYTPAVYQPAADPSRPQWERAGAAAR